MDSLETLPIPTGLVDVREIGVVISVEMKDGYPALRIYSDALPHGNLIHVFRPEIQYRVHSEHERPAVVRHLLGNVDYERTPLELGRGRTQSSEVKACAECANKDQIIKMEDASRRSQTESLILASELLMALKFKYYDLLSASGVTS